MNVFQIISQHDKQLVESSPMLYRDRHANAMKTSMCWGFSCGMGWYKIISDLSRKLEAEIKKCSKPSQYRAAQVKQKFGTLRFYMTKSTEAMGELIGKAEKKSAVTCELCGKRGTLRKIRLTLFTLCDKCNRQIRKGG